ncbi:hypothetical protein BJ912DRAFT_1012905 [Pholiota molesta]|nr:hypothetical protein BJ912DRAFT_1012905 [Pholiota molesta]
MKVLKYRSVFRLPGWRHTATQPEVPNEPRVVEEIKKKALTDWITSPGLLKSPNGRSKHSHYLKGPHRDVRAMRELLINVYHYEPQDITILIDDDNSCHVQPTRINIVSKAIDDLIKDAKEHDRFFFHCKLRNTYANTDDIEEEDRKNEFIITSEGEKIKDDELRANLAMPLPAGSSLIAHFRCNRVYVPWINKGTRRTKSLWNENKRMQARKGGPVARLNKQVFTWARHLSTECSPLNGLGCGWTWVAAVTAQAFVVDYNGCSSSPAPWLDSPSAREKQFMSPVAMYCTGFCREDDLFTYDNAVEADVISISSSKDSQLTWEDANGTHSMTQILVKELNVSHEIHKFYVDLHTRAKTYKKTVQAVNKAKMLMGKKIRPGDPVEMNNFQNPQLSTDRPLDMSRHFYP